MDSGETPGSLQRESCQEIVKRYYGKAAKDKLPLSAGQPSTQWRIQDLGKGGAVCQCKGRRAPKARGNKLGGLG